jgi:hypothetical protein
MNGGQPQSWRDVVYAYLQACREDELRRRELQVSGSEARFLEEHATPTLKELRDNAARLEYESLGRPPVTESYEAIEQSADRAVVQVSPPGPRLHNRHCIPFLITRLSLMKQTDEWRIEAICQPCVACNVEAITSSAPSPTLGQCFACGGSGIDYERDVEIRGFWPFRRRVVVTRPCRDCGGTGKCPHCTREDAPGWVQVFSISGLGLSDRE